MNNGLKLAIEAAGSRARLSRALRVTRGAISNWTRIPAERVIQVEAATGIPRHMLRPDLYPPVPRKRRSGERTAACL